MKPDLRGEATAGDVRRVAMDLLSRREHARRELHRKLAARGFAESLIEPVLDGLARDGLQSDARYLESAVSRAAGRGKGPQYIRSWLRSRGVTGGAVDAALADSDVDWLELAGTVRRRKFGEAPPSDYAARAKQARFLAQRGFDAELIHRLLGDL